MEFRDQAGKRMLNKDPGQEELPREITNQDNSSLQNPKEDYFKKKKAFGIKTNAKRLNQNIEGENITTRFSTVKGSVDWIKAGFHKQDRMG